MNEIKVTKLKAKNKRKTQSKKKRVHNTCPYCLSKLVKNEVGSLDCSGDKLRIWETEFLKFVKLTEDDKIVFLRKLTNDSMFLELFERWERSKKNNSPKDFSCTYSNKLFNPITKIRTSMADPIMVAKIERSLGRKLTEEEINGEVEIWREGNSFFSDYKKGRVKVRIPKLIFPDSFL